eukprot:7928151-Alexandrium_andersonii.AAC.1
MDVQPWAPTRCPMVDLLVEHHISGRRPDLRRPPLPPAVRLRLALACSRLRRGELRPDAQALPVQPLPLCPWEAPVSTPVRR